MMKKKWIQDAVKPENKGKFSAKAKSAGKSTAEYAEEKAESPGALGREARFAKTMIAINKNK